MKKLIVLLSVLILFVTGCSVHKLDNDDIHKNVEALLEEKVSLYNVFYGGYKYYLPKGVQFIDKDDYNAILRDGNNNRYYLYVDAISYYNEVKNNYKVLGDVFYSERIEYHKKNGYIQIEEIDSMYFIQFVFNYTKIEAYVSKKDLMDTIVNMSCILRTIKFNDVVLESLIGDNVLDYKEEDYTLFKADSSKESFLDVVERSETDKYKKDLEDEKIDLED